jgi:4-hydroxy-tetrahydrodipicolinate reductase
MKVSLIGYGKMGKVIEKILKQRGHQVKSIIDQGNVNDLKSKKFAESDVAIEFSVPGSAFENLKACITAGVPVVSGTTGWLDKKPELDHYCRENEGGYLYASNFSIGVNIFFSLNKKLASLMSPFDQYKVRMTEIHHTTKLDAPSGTGITLAEGIIENIPEYKEWINEETDDPKKLPIISKRIKDAPGTHIIEYVSEVDEIKIEHEAKSRQGFAVGAVIAAEWMVGKNGVYSMSDVLGF